MWWWWWCAESETKQGEGPGEDHNHIEQALSRVCGKNNAINIYLSGLQYCGLNRYLI